jgi:hypothetical protein
MSFLLFSACQSSNEPEIITPPEEEPLEMNSEVSEERAQDNMQQEELAFEINVPEDWTKTASYENDMVVFEIIKQTEAQNVLSINVVKEHAPGYTLQSYYDANRENMQYFLPGFEIIDEEKIKLNSGLEVYKMTYSAVFNRADLKFMVYITMKDENGYAITATFLEEDFENYKEELENIVKSFKFLN